QPQSQTQPVTAMNLIDATAQFSDTRTTRLPANYIWATLKDRAQDAKVNDAFERALAHNTEKNRLALLREIELKFIHDPNTSGLDILGPELSHHFRTFNWHQDDFPGGPKGPNEQFADVMVDALDLVLPERRANSTRNAVVLRSEVNDAVWGLITNKWTTVPGQERFKLNPHALESFLRMREEANRDGVDLIINSAHRYPETAQRNAARSGNPNAVASFSAHSLGLAIDFKMSHRNEFQTREGSTGSMPAMVHMRQSPVHKWLVLNAEKFGWYPYQNEPWHWEYNPPGFRQIFWAEFPGGAPQREIMIDTP
ncbi:MAG: D-alanyl-D-alanine carboxypeptidase family protein, partial [Limisphaerales bacterium]